MQERECEESPHKENAMSELINKSRAKERSSATERKQIALELTASQRRLLQILATGIEGEPDVLAGRP